VRLEVRHERHRDTASDHRLDSEQHPTFRSLETSEEPVIMNDELELTGHLGADGADGANGTDGLDTDVMPSLRPIAGVSLDLYARIVRSIATMNHDLSMLAPMAALHGVDHDAWVEARTGWNQRIAVDGAVNSLFCVLYETG